jgi:AmmeMemoRadiSam system protein A
MSSLGSRDKQSLLELARRSLTLAVQGLDPQDLPDSQILQHQQSAGAFVTLRHRGRLRGCIGQLQLAANVSLTEIVAHCTKSAALEDPRFDAVRGEELAEIEIELSVLSPPENVTIEQIEIGKHGLLVSRGWERGVLLPQVAAQFHWNARRFLEETCAKAGFERDAWRDPATQVQAFTAEVFSESDFRSVPAQ